jgi:hypothetical protein
VPVVAVAAGTVAVPLSTGSTTAFAKPTTVNRYWQRRRTRKDHDRREKGRRKEEALRKRKSCVWGSHVNALW